MSHNFLVNFCHYLVCPEFRLRFEGGRTFLGRYFFGKFFLRFTVPEL